MNRSEVGNCWFSGWRRTGCKPTVQEPAGYRWFQYACCRANIYVRNKIYSCIVHWIMICRRGKWCSLLTTLQVADEGPSPEFLSVDREINVLQSCLFSKHSFLRTSFRDVFFPFWWRSMLSSHLSLGLLLVSFTSSLTASAPWALTLPLSSWQGQTIEVCSDRVREQWVAY